MIVLLKTILGVFFPTKIAQWFCKSIENPPSLVGITGFIQPEMDASILR
jgi:hypothetical protein